MTEQDQPNRNPYEHLSLVERNAQLKQAYLLYPKHEMRKPEGYDPGDFEPGLLEGKEKDNFAIAETIETWFARENGEEYDQEQAMYLYQSNKRQENSAYLPRWQQNHRFLLILAPITQQYRDFITKGAPMLATHVKEDSDEDYFHLGLGRTNTEGIFAKVSAVELERQGYFHEFRTVTWLMEDREAEEQRTGLPSEAYEEPRLNLVQWRQNFIKHYAQEP